LDLGGSKPFDDHHRSAALRAPPPHIEDDEPRGRPKWKRFSQLLNDPQAGRVPCDVDVQDPSNSNEGENGSLVRIACAKQQPMSLISKADRILANDRNHEIEALATYRSHQPFAVGVYLGALAPACAAPLAQKP